MKKEVTLCQLINERETIHNESPEDKGEANSKSTVEY